MKGFKINIGIITTILIMSIMSLLFVSCSSLRKVGLSDPTQRIITNVLVTETFIQARDEFCKEEEINKTAIVTQLQSLGVDISQVKCNES